MTVPGPAPTVHATAVVVGETGVLLRGASGSGKSTLARALVEAANRAGRFAAFVADDRVILAPADGRLVARAPDTIAGLAELRGFGIVAIDHEAAAVVRLVVDLVPGESMERMPAPDGSTVRIEGIDLVRIAVPERSLAQALALVEAAVATSCLRKGR
jgi:serine kinase of HPr protein (carbohydrate metabolism regulator)